MLEAAPGGGAEYVRGAAERAEEITDHNVLIFFSLRRQFQQPGRVGTPPLQKVFGFFVAHLSKLLINDPKLEIVAYDVFIEGNDKSRSL